MARLLITLFRKLANLWPRRPRSVAALALVVFLATATSLYLWLPVQPRWSFTTGIYPHVIGFTPDGRTLLVNPCGKQGPIWLLDTASGRLVKELLTEDWVGTSAPALSSDGKLLACMDGYRLLIVNVDDGQVLENVQLSESERTWGECRFSPDGQTLIFSVCPQTNVTTLTVWDVPSRKERYKLANEGFPAIFSTDGLHLFSVSPTSTSQNPITGVSGEIKIRDVLTGQTIRTLKGAECTYWRLGLLPGGKTLAGSCSFYDPVSKTLRPSIRLWDTTTWEELNNVSGDASLVITTDGQFVVRKHDLSERLDTIAFLDSRSGSLSRYFTSSFKSTGQAYSDSPTLSPDGRFVAMGMGHRVQAGKLRERLARSTGIARLANSSSWYELKLFDVASEKGCATISGDSPPDGLLALKPLFSPDSTMLATSGYEQIRLWDAPPRRPWGWIVAISLLPVALVLLRSYGANVVLFHGVATYLKQRWQ